jgi:hypothetical protein
VEGGEGEWRVGGGDWALGNLTLIPAFRCLVSDV